MERKDKYYTKAKKDNYRSRASYKLLELQSKFNIIEDNSSVVEFGSAPGGWTQVLKGITSKSIICIDINNMEAIDGVTFLRGNINDPGLKSKINDILMLNNMPCVSTVLSDAMVHTSGDYSRDHYESYMLCENVMKNSYDLLCHGGNMVLKQFQGEMTSIFINEWKSKFNFYRITKPNASRQHSREVYIILKGKH
ncbi:MAG: RlmE family RNA methyltransferase [Ferroplasma sp.]